MGSDAYPIANMLIGVRQNNTALVISTIGLTKRLVASSTYQKAALIFTNAPCSLGGQLKGEALPAW